MRIPVPGVNAPIASLSLLGPARRLILFCPPTMPVMGGVAVGDGGTGVIDGVSVSDGIGVKVGSGVRVITGVAVKRGVSVTKG